MRCAVCWRSFASIMVVCAKASSAWISGSFCCPFGTQAAADALADSAAKRSCVVRIARRERRRRHRPRCSRWSSGSPARWRARHRRPSARRRPSRRPCRAPDPCPSRRCTRSPCWLAVPATSAVALSNGGPATRIGGWPASTLKKLFAAAIAEAADSEVAASLPTDVFSALRKLVEVAAVDAPMVNSPGRGWPRPSPSGSASRSSRRAA